jgi:hypothetical protein
MRPETLASAKFKQIENGVRANFGTKTQLDVQLAGECSTVTWTSSELPSIQDCIDYGDAHW